MNSDAAIDSFLTALGSGAVTLRAFMGREPQDFDTIAPTDAKRYIAAAGWLYGTTRYTMQQRRTVEAAVANGLSLSVLAMIADYVGSLTTEREQWVLWRELTAEALPAGVIAARADKRVKELKQPKAKRGIALRTTRGADGMGTLTFTAPQVEIADITRSLQATAESLMDEDDKKSKAQASGEAFATMLATGAGVAPSGVIPMVNITLEEHAQVLRGDYDGIRLACSDGTELTGEEYAQRALFNMGIYNILSRIHGSLDNFRDERFATEKQRLAAFAENVTCAAPGCSRPFDDCQLHHVIAFKNGGFTNISNLVPLCKYHNGKNDDDWVRRLNGHVEKRGPFAYWVSAYGYKDRRNEHRLATLGAAHKLFG